MAEPLLGQGVRVPWEALPPAVRDAVAGVVSDRVVAAQTCVGGFSPGAAAALTLAGGGRAFVKAVSTAQNPRTPDMYRREAAVQEWLPRHPSLPALLGTYDDGNWVALVFEYADGCTPELPWVAAELDAVLAAAGDVQRAAGDVSGVAPSIVSMYQAEFSSWRAIVADPPTGLDAWSRAHAAELASVETGWADAARGDALLHTDLRADNALVGAGRAWIVDWPWACAGAAWVDVAFMAPSVVHQGGPDPDALLRLAYPDTPPAALLPVVAALAGFFTLSALAPAPPGLTLRAHQAALGRTTREWLARLLAC